MKEYKIGLHDESIEAYLDVLNDSDNQNEASRLNVLFQYDRERIISDVFENIQHVNELKVDRKHASGKVRQGWDVMEKFVNFKPSELRILDLVPVTYGPIIFDSTKEPENSLILVKKEKPRRNHRKMITEWHDRFREICEWEGMEYGGITTILSTDRIREISDRFRNKDVEFIGKYAPDIWLDLAFVADMLVGEQIPFGSSEKLGDPKLLDSYRRDILNMAVKSPILLTSIADDLQQIIAREEVKRHGLSDFQTGEREIIFKYNEEEYQKSIQSKDN